MVRVTASNVDLEVFIADEIEVTFRGPYDEVLEMIEDIKAIRV
jgi:hypothetical protein